MKRAFLGLLALSCSGDGGPSTPAIPEWQRGLPPADVMQERRGMTPVRGIIHLHSPYSHDACDGDPRPGGVPDEECLQHLRDALCTTRMSFAALTDHDDSMADETWSGALFLEREGDELLVGDDGLPYANRMACPDGHSVLVTVGGENDLMPIMLDRHPDGDAKTRHNVYNGNTPDHVATFRSLGGLAWIAHSESKELAELGELRLDGMEIYNLHAAIDADIREQYLGLDPGEATQRALQFADASEGGPEPDLAIVSFLEAQTPSLQKWDALLRGGQRVVGSAGTDAHENALPIIFKDGERGDSYRRMLRWFSNVVLVDDPDDPRAIEASLAVGRAFVAFEILGTPVGFDMWADRMTGERVELGGEALASDRVTIVAVTPHVHDLASHLPQPAIRTVIFHVGEGETEQVAAGEGAVQFAVDKPGAYRAEVRIIPRHLTPYFGTLAAQGYAEREYVWVYSNPIYVR